MTDNSEKKINTEVGQWLSDFAEHADTIYSNIDENGNPTPALMCFIYSLKIKKLIKENAFNLEENTGLLELIRDAHLDNLEKINDIDSPISPR